MAVDSDIDWPMCTQDGCIGVQLADHDRCWAHADDSDLAAHREQLGSDRLLDGRGVAFTGERLKRVLDAIPQDNKGHRRLTAAMFNKATFEGDADFGRATFEGNAEFRGATFERSAWFGEATFKAAAGFTQTTFKGDAKFQQANFIGEAGFDNATFKNEPTFGEAGFDNATFKNEATFGGATFKGGAWFPKVTFEGDAQFGGATFEGGAWFRKATFEGDARFRGATFERARQLGPIPRCKSLVLDSATFRERIRIEVTAAALSCKQARFLDGVQLWVRKAEVVLDDADLAAPSVVSGSWPGEPRSALLPQVLSVRGADLAGLTVAGVDLQACHFVRAHHLDQLRAEASNFAQTPRGWGRTKRRIIAEEQEWRATRKPSWGWGPRPHEWLLPNQVAPLYRDLRKGLEDNKDEPGAADFYYGEMEMRRHAKRRKQVRREHTQGLRDSGFGISAATEWAILTLYWLVSGYGLRAWRALTSLAAVVLVASFIFVQWGFDEQHQPAFPTALRYSAQATTALLRGPANGGLTETGEWLQIALRLIGPVLLGLAVLSIRGRVKR